MRTAVIRLGVVLFIVPAITWTIISRVWRETRWIPFYCWHDVRDELGAARRYWSGDIG